MFLNRKTHYYQDAHSFQLDLQSQHDPTDNSSELLCGSQQSDPKLTKRQRPKTADSTSNNQVRGLILCDCKTP